MVSGVPLSWVKQDVIYYSICYMEKVISPNTLLATTACFYDHPHLYFLVGRGPLICNCSLVILGSMGADLGVNLQSLYERGCEDKYIFVSKPSPWNSTERCSHSAL